MSDLLCRSRKFTILFELDYFVVYLQVNRLTTCDACTVLKEEKKKNNVRNYLDELYKIHNTLQM